MTDTKPLPELPAPEKMMPPHSRHYVGYVEAYSAATVERLRLEAYELGARSTAAQPIAEGLLQSACARLLANANWSVAGALSPASKRKDFPSNGWASVKLRDLASVRDTLSAASGDSTPPSEPADGEQLWLWQNGDHFLAFRHLYPCYSPGGDPMTLGEPFGRAIFKHSHDRSVQGDPSGAPRAEPEAAGAIDAAVAAERERCALEAEHWQKISLTPGHACGQYIAAAIRKGASGEEAT